MKRNPPNLFFVDHLEELRSRLIKCLLAFFLGTCLVYPFLDSFLRLIVQPVGTLVFTAPSEALVVRLQLALWGGFFLALPVMIYQIWMFVSAALTEPEKKYVLFFAPASFLLFVAGAAFAYFVMIPFCLSFFLSFSRDWLVPMITVKNYLSFAGTFVLAFAVTFELPLILMFLTKIGIATPAFLIQKRRHAIVLILIVSAVITPPDVVSQIIMACPLMILYEIGIFFSRLTYRKK